MKWTSLFLIVSTSIHTLSAALAPVQNGATSTLTATAPGAARTAPLWQPKTRRAHETEWQAVTLITNPVTQRVRAVTNSYIQLGTGLNHRDPATGRWRPSDPAFRITERGAESTAGAHTVLLAPDIGTVGSVTVRSGELTMQSHPLCVGYYDPADGRSVRLAEITNAIGWLVNSNEVVYSNCFNGLRASIRIRNSHAGVEQDLLIHEQPAFTPADFGFSRLARLELFTEFIGDTPTPQATSRVLAMERIPPGMPDLVEHEFKDSILDFGPMQMSLGRAFSTSPRGPRDRDRIDTAPVGKRFEIINGRKILIEAVSVRHIESVLTNLPMASLPGVLTNAALPPSPLGGERAGVRGAGRRDVIAKSIFQPRSDDPIRSLPIKRLALNSKPASKIQTAALSPSPLGGARAGARGAASNPQSPASSPNSDLVLVLDYQLLINSPLHNHTFAADTTYLCSGQVDFTGTTTFEGGTVIKYTEFDDPEEGTPAYAILHIKGPIDCKTDAYHPAVFTSIYDQTVGETIDTSRSPGYFFQAIAFNNLWDSPYGYGYGGGPPLLRQLKHLQFRYASYALHSGWVNVDLRHSRFDHCQYPFYPEYGQWNVANVLVHDAEFLAFGGFYQFVGTHMTVNECATLFGSWSDPALCAALLYNHILADVDGLGTVGVNVTLPELLSSDGLFQSVGGGHHYLADNTYRDNAPSPIDSALTAEFRQMTTHPPLPRSGELSVPTTYGKVISRDLGPPFDRGYHYPAVDWFVTSMNVVNAALLVTNGAVVAVASSGTPYGLRLDSGASLISEGTPGEMNRFVRPHAVQEDPGTLDQERMFDSLHPVATQPTFQLRFTDVPLMSASILFNQANGQGSIGTMTLRDSQVRGGTIYLSPGSGSQIISCRNTLFERVSFAIFPYPPMTMSFRNNTFFHGAFTLSAPSVGSWSLYDNLFYKTILWQHPSAVFDHDYNGYIAGSNRLLPHGEEDAVVADFTFQPGTLGRHYLPDSSALINAGSQGAAAAGLYHFTTVTSQDKDVTTVDIGLHYVALNGLDSQPLDTDADGLADYFEDADGNGVYSPGDDLANWSNWDTDDDGMSDSQEYQAGRNPKDAECPRDAYEAVIGGQIPNFWFKINDSSSNSANGGQVLAIPTGGNGTGGNFDTDLFDKMNGAFVLDPSTDVRTPVNASTSVPVDVISGGSGSSKGSISLLFRSLTGLEPTGTGSGGGKRYLICQKGSGSQEFGVFFENHTASVDPSSYKVDIGGQTVTILQSASIVFGAWYYLAITWDETAGVDRWKWYVGRVGGTLTTPEDPINLANNVGNSSTVFVGNRQNNPDGTGTFTSAFRNPGKGALDQIAFWDRELTSGEIAAQFAALPHGPSVNFDLSGWNILLPVDDAGGFSGAPHTVDRVQLSSGFQYIDPGSCTKKYFYRGIDGANGTMVFEAPWNGAGSNPRSELRGLKYDVTEKKYKEDNWIPGLGGTHTLNGTCIVNEAGAGKIVIGQIHAETPKTPDNSDLPPDADLLPDGAVPAIILYYDNTTDPNNQNDPDKPYIKVSVYDRVDRSNFPGDGDADGVVHHTILTRVSPGTELNYELKIVADGSNCVLHVTVNGMNPAVHPIQMHQKDIGWPNRWTKTAPNNPVPFNPEDDATRLYFKAGCYYPDFTGSGVTAKVTFKSLSVTHQ